MARRSVGVGALVAVALAAVLWAALARAGGAVEVDAVRIRRGGLEVALPVSGVVETAAVDLAFEIPGRLAEVRAREGDTVRAGQVLAALDRAEAAAAAAQAAAAADAARSEAARARASVEAARQQARQAEAAYRAAQATLAQLHAGARSEELAQARAALEAADTHRRQAQRTYDVNRQLAQQGAVAQAQVDAARAQAEAAEAQYRQAAAQYEALRAGTRPEALAVAVEQARQAAAAAAAARANVRQAQALAAAAEANTRQAVAAAQAARARARRVLLTAPFDAVVSRVYVSPGAAVAPSVPIVTLVGQGGWITAEVDEADIDAVRIGQAARITADAYPAMVLTGRVTRIGGAVELRGGNRVVRVRIDPVAPIAMRAGTSVDVAIVQRTIADVLLVPLDAVQPAEDGAAEVFVIERGTLRRRAVRLGERNDELAQVVAGLREGEAVALGDAAVMRDGARIRLRSRR